MPRSVLRLGLSIGLFGLPLVIACSGSDGTSEAPPSEIPSHQRLIDAHKKLSAKIIELDARVQKLPKEARLSAFGAHVDALVATNASMQSGSNQIAASIASAGGGGSGGLPSLDAGATDAGFSSGFSGDGNVDVAILDGFASKIQEASDQIRGLLTQLDALAKELEAVRAEQAQLKAALDDAATANDGVRVENDAWFAKTAPKVVGRATIIGNLVSGGTRTQRHRLSLALLPGPTKLTYVCTSDKGTPNVAVETSEGPTKGAGTVTLDVNVATAKLVDWKLVTDIPATCTVTVDTPSASTNEPALSVETVDQVHAAALKRSEQMAKLFSEIARLEQEKAKTDPRTAAYLAATRGNLEDQLVNGYLSLEFAANRDRRDGAFAKQLAIMARDTRIRAEQEKLDAQREEANRRYQQAMDQATASILTGLVSGAAQTQSSIVESLGVPALVKKK